jgi:parallel beta-helix repeat protein
VTTGTNYGLYLSASNSVIRNNAIDGSTVSSNNATGIMSTVSGSPLIYNNTLYGLKSYNTYGIYIDGGSAKIYNNYIHCGVADSAASGINFGSASTPSIINNIISGVGNPTGFGMYERNNNKPTEVQNNNFIAFSNPGGYYRVTGGTTVYRTISALEAEFSGLPFSGVLCSGNTDAAPVFDSSYRLVSGTPSSIYAGGINLAGEGFNTDADCAVVDGGIRVQPVDLKQLLLALPCRQFFSARPCRAIRKSPCFAGGAGT